MTKRPRNVANDIIDATESATRKWTRQKKSEERHPGMVRYRASRMTKEPTTKQKKAAWQVMEDAYMAASNGGRLPTMARQIYYQARPKIMAMTSNKQLAYGYFSQKLLPDYIEEKGVSWNVVYDARGHFEEPHTNISIGCGTIGVRNYIRAMRGPEIVEADLKAGHVRTIGPRGNVAAILFCEKEGFGPLFKAVDLANRYDLMIISTKGVSVTAARQLVETICGPDIPLFALHDFDVAGFMIFGTLSRDTRRYKFSSFVNPISLGLRLDDIDGLEREPAAATKTRRAQRVDQRRADRDDRDQAQGAWSHEGRPKRRAARRHLRGVSQEPGARGRVCQAAGRHDGRGRCRGPRGSRRSGPQAPRQASPPALGRRRTPHL